MVPGSNASWPAATGVWVVKTMPAEAIARASSKVRSLLAHQLADPLERQERRVALVQVADFRAPPEHVQRSQPADPQQQLLANPHVAVAAVQPAGDRAVGRLVLLDVGVEQEQRDPTHLHLPDPDVERRGQGTAARANLLRRLRRGPDGSAGSSGSFSGYCSSCQPSGRSRWRK